MSASFEATFPSTPPGVGAIRRQIAEFAARCGMSAEGIDAVRLAVSEAVTNAVIHAYRGDDSEGDLSVRAGVESGEFVVVVADRGIGLAPRRDSPGLGLGMPLMASVTSRFRVVSRGAGTEVHMAFPLQPDGSGNAH